MSAIPERDALFKLLAPYGQEHVLRWWDELSAPEREHLAEQIRRLDLIRLQMLYREALTDAPQAAAFDPRRVHCAPVLRLPQSFEDWLALEEAAQLGEEALKAGQVAIVIVAGGQGTRLGFNGPKGAFPIGPVSNASLFQILSEKVLALSRRCEARPPLFLMTSPDNDAETRAYFAEHRHFGLPSEDVVFFAQGLMPAVDRCTGKLLMTSKSELALSPNGHGGVLPALADGGHLDALERRDVRYLFYCQVDNPLVKMADPAYLGQHIQAGAEMSVKVVEKTGPAEPVGSVVEIDGRVRMIEYSELGPELAQRRSAAGQLDIWAGSIAIHCFSLSFLRRLARNASMLPYHRAMKKVSFLDERGELVKPAEPNAIKFEMFIFDALPLAEKILVVETDRREEFEPLKNADGPYSPTSVRQAMSNLFAEWLNHAGVEVARQPDGSAAVAIEISPLFAADAEELRARLQRTEAVSGPLYLGPNQL
jgi:UDP-N-acetylglucosamine/UDP-N-acetylgalactosamine diphosphorylase